MIRQVLLLLAILPVTSAAAQSLPLSYDDLEKRKNEAGVTVHYYEGQLFSGKTYDYFENEKFAREQHLDNGLLVLTEGFRDGKKVEYVEYKAGVLDGVFLNYFGNGQKYIEHHYRQGKMHGRQYGWTQDGTVRFIANYRDGIEIMRLNYPPPGGFEKLIKN